MQRTYQVLVSLLVESAKRFPDIQGRRNAENDAINTAPGPLRADDM